ncbi:hypothetical protein A2686_01570 [Candidatus Woesebacteria bacterium RIFCSPHIGHO2_01_FULL_38_10]|nr:MAG: hypothetical protein A2686_01570 [Candidatus Woesebacteria bacterium RIFCSPHIGHO2_01_FULL_38_10]
MKKKIIFKYLSIFLITLLLPALIHSIGKKTSFYNQAYQNLTGTKAQIVVDLKNPELIDEFSWNNLAQGGEEISGMLDPVKGELKNLKPKYIRIDHVFDFYKTVKKDALGNFFYDWTKLDKEISIILETGAKPFISLSYMPDALSKGNEVDEPVSWNEWKELIRKTVEHISGRGGLKISDVYYEVWNEPDLFGGFKPGGTKDYLALYQYAAIGANEAKDTLPFKFGGPATTSLYKNWFDSLIKFVNSNNLPLDFFSWHRYSKYLEDYEKDYYDLKSWILAHPKYSGIELVISEFGHNSDADILYDKNFSAIHTLAVYSTLFPKIQKIFLFEIKDGPGGEKYWGRWGILTHEKLGTPEKKPRYKAIEFLNKMNGSWYPVYGQGSWVKAIATTDRKVVRLLVVNYDPFEKHHENVPVSFLNLFHKEFTFRRLEFLGAVAEYEVKVGGDSWTTSQMMAPNSAVILEITPKEN